ncbi:10497_t:CDS:2 [Diversispora eburnea]|uniref:10497_t:CDS:1 n=1 Tax=Diversispora eburnea TaxID=1213867 RepID=A0A9N9AKN9_9GLOM|nr:10497_t:CDS:2 [Diversispora eburnea]
MEFYIPPQGLFFRLQNYKTKYAIFSRNSLFPNFYHYKSVDKYDDQYWTLIPGTGKHSGYFRIENYVTNADKYDDQYWTLIPGTGKHSGYFRIENYVTKYAIFSRFSTSPNFYHYKSVAKYDDQYWTFIFENMIVEGVDYKFDEGKVLNVKSIHIGRQTLTNNTDAIQTMAFKVSESQRHTSKFEHTSGFSLTIKTEFSVGIPEIMKADIGLEVTTTSNTYTYGEEISSEKIYLAEFPVNCLPKSKVVAVATINKGNLTVPYIMHLKSKNTGFKIDTYGTYSGVTTWNLGYTVDQISDEQISS